VWSVLCSLTREATAKVLAATAQKSLKGHCDDCRLDGPDTITSNYLQARFLGLAWACHTIQIFHSRGDLKKVLVEEAVSSKGAATS